MIRTKDNIFQREVNRYKQFEVDLLKCTSEERKLLVKARLMSVFFPVESSLFESCLAMKTEIRYKKEVKELKEKPYRDFYINKMKEERDVR